MKTIKGLIQNMEFTTADVDFDAFDEEMTQFERESLAAEQYAIAMACQTFLNA